MIEILNPTYQRNSLQRELLVCVHTIQHKLKVYATKTREPYYSQSDSRSNLRIATDRESEFPPTTCDKKLRHPDVYNSF